MIYRMFIMVLLILPYSTPIHAAPVAMESHTPKPPLTLELAIQRVLEHNPELAAFSWDIKAKQGAVEQESRKPNPELELEIENIAGTNETKGLKSAEYTFLVSQDITLAGKRQKRMAAAQLDQRISQKELDVKRADLIWQTRKQFLELQYLQQKMNFRRMMKQMAQQFLEKVKIRIQAGRTSPAEQARAEVALIRSQMELNQLSAELTLARQQLAALWAGDHADFERVEGKLALTASPMPLDLLINNLQNNKDLSLMTAGIEHRLSLLTIEKANRKPDLTISSGIRHMNDAKSTAFVAAISLPVPLFDKNRGNIKTAAFLVEKARAEKKAAHTMLVNRLKYLHGQMAIIHQNAITLRDTVIPKALEAYQVMLAGYSEGKFTYLDVLDAYVSSVGSMEEYLQTLYEYRQLETDIQRLADWKK